VELDNDVSAEQHARNFAELQRLRRELSDLLRLADSIKTSDDVPEQEAKIRIANTGSIHGIEHAVHAEVDFCEFA
jgi:hypothetical protein